MFISVMRHAEPSWSLYTCAILLQNHCMTPGVGSHRFLSAARQLTLDEGLGEPEELTIEDVFFPVEQRTIYLPAAESGEGTTSRESFHKLPRHRAIIDVERDHVFAVVSDSYRLVTNFDAVLEGVKCFQVVFSQETSEKMEFYAAHMPKSRSFCHVDFTLAGYEFVPMRGDAWLPFLRVTNSYNRSKPLVFDFGFCRALCKNGVIFGAKRSAVKRYHTYGRMGLHAKGLNMEGVLKLQNEFTEKLQNLGRFHVSPQQMLALACKVFKIEVTDTQLQDPRSTQRLITLGRHLRALTANYSSEMGHTAYAALNVLTDFASRPVGLGFAPESRMHSLQERSGRWIEEFVAEAKKDSFRIEQYVVSATDTADLLSKLAQDAPSIRS